MRFFLLFLVVVAGPAQADVTLFETPSGNIECSIGESRTSVDIICEIIQREGPPALPRPATCGQTWGHRFELYERGPVQMTCSAPRRDSEIDEKAPYGVSATWGGITCHSEKTGFTCRNADGHGFFLSRRTQQVF